MSQPCPSQASTGVTQSFQQIEVDGLETHQWYPVVMLGPASCMICMMLVLVMVELVMVAMMCSAVAVVVMEKFGM